MHSLSEEISFLCKFYDFETRNKYKRWTEQKKKLEVENTRWERMLAFTLPEGLKTVFFSLCHPVNFSWLHVHTEINETNGKKCPAPFLLVSIWIWERIQLLYVSRRLCVAYNKSITWLFHAILFHWMNKVFVSLFSISFYVLHYGYVCVFVIVLCWMAF